MTTTELAVELRRHPKTIRNWRRLRVGPPYYRVRGRVLYDLEQVADWLARGGRTDAIGTRNSAKGS